MSGVFTGRTQKHFDLVAVPLSIIPAGLGFVHCSQGTSGLAGSTLLVFSRVALRPEGQGLCLQMPEDD